jgi:hypothetical protein
MLTFGGAATGMAAIPFFYRNGTRGRAITRANTGYDPAMEKKEIPQETSGRRESGFHRVETVQPGPADATQAAPRNGVSFIDRVDGTPWSPWSPGHAFTVLESGQVAPQVMPLGRQRHSLIPDAGSETCVPAPGQNPCQAERHLSLDRTLCRTKPGSAHERAARYLVSPATVSASSFFTSSTTSLSAWS